MKSAHPFTGKEKDSETGYYYHGARYYDPTTVNSWTTVDPMLDKYLDISPYAYCAWNPMKYVDPDGRDVRLSKTAQAIHNKYYNQKGSERYTELYNKIANDHSVFFNVKEYGENELARKNGANGIVYYSQVELSQYENGSFDIEWGEPNDAFGGTMEHVLLEELFHAGQIIENDYSLSTTIKNEYDAKRFAVETSSELIKESYRDSGFEHIPTELYIIGLGEPARAKKYLRNGERYTEIINGTPKTALIGGNYAELP